ncbi:MAG: hypothetical protein EA398_01990, partial [Deltaproteobacteria bacterium]
LLTSAVLLALPMGEAWSQARPIEAFSTTPTATIILDTSGGTEFTPCPDGSFDCPTAGPPICACVNPPSEFHAECAGFWAGLGYTDYDPGFPIPAAVMANVYRGFQTRFHIAQQAIAGTIENYFCAWDYRDPTSFGPTGARRMDVVDPARPQGIPHARACSYLRPPESTESSEDFLDRFCGDGRQCTQSGSDVTCVQLGDGVRYLNDGLLSSSRDLVHFGFATLDSFQESGEGPQGMWSYACSDPPFNDVWTRSTPGAPSPDPNPTLRTCLGLRSPTASEGPLRVPVLSGAGGIGAAQVESIRDSLRSIVPYWATPLAAGLHDVRHMLTFDPVFAADDERVCRPHNVILVSDSVPTYSRRFVGTAFNPSGELRDVCDVFPSLAGCENYWYPGLEEIAEGLFRRTIAGSGDPDVDEEDVIFPINLYNIAFALNAEERDISERELLSSFSLQAEALGAPFLLDAADLDELRSALGTALSAVLEGHLVSRTAPAVTTSTRNFSSGRDDGAIVPLSRFEAFTRISEFSPLWGGSVNRVDWICEYDEDEGFTVLAPEEQTTTEPVAWRSADRLDERLEVQGVETRTVLTNGPVDRCVSGSPMDTSVLSPFEPRLTGTMGSYFPTLFTDDPIGVSLTLAELQGACPGATGGEDDPCDELALGGARLRPEWNMTAFNVPTCLAELSAEAPDQSIFFSDDNPDCTFTAFGVTSGDLAGGSGSSPVLCTDPAEVFEAAQRFVRQTVRFVRGATIQELLDDPDFVDYPPPYPSDPDEFDPLLNDRPTRFGSVMFSNPVVVPPPSSALPFQGLQDEVDGLLNEVLIEGADPIDDVTVGNRPTMLYVGSDSGLLHAIEAATGVELWSFYPSTLLRRSRLQVRAHLPMVDGTPVVREMRVFRGTVGDDPPERVDRWRTVLVFGLRQGGRGYVALDVSNPFEPHFLWQIDETNDPAMGQTYGKAALATVRLADCSGFPSRPLGTDIPAYMTDDPASGPCERGVAILPGGVDPRGLQASPRSSLGRVLLVVDVITGTVIRRITTLGNAPEVEPRTCEEVLPGEQRCVPAGGAGGEECHPEAASGFGTCGEGFDCVGFATNETILDRSICIMDQVQSYTCQSSGGGGGPLDPVLESARLTGNGHCVMQSVHNSASFCSWPTSVFESLGPLDFPVTLFGSMVGDCGFTGMNTQMATCRTRVPAVSCNVAGESCISIGGCGNEFIGRCYPNLLWPPPDTLGCSNDNDCESLNDVEISYEPGTCVPEETCTSTEDCNPEVTEIPAALSGSALAFDTFAGNLATRAFLGDEEGRLLRLDLSSPNPSEWSLGLFFDPAAAAIEFGEPDIDTGEPVLFEPTIAYRGNLDRAVVLYGQGDLNQLQGSNDISGGIVNHVFSLTERPRFDREGRLLPETAEVNWILRLDHPGERITARPRIFNNVAYFATYLPRVDNPCEIGDARLYGVHYFGPPEDPDDPEEPTRYVQLTNHESDEEDGLAVLGRLPGNSVCAEEAETPFIHYCDASAEEDALITPRSIINGLDFVQMPSCFLRPGLEDDGTAPLPDAGGQAGGFQLMISQSSAAPTESADRGARATTRLVDGILEEPDAPALPTSWGLISPW